MENHNKQETKSHSLTPEFIPYEQALELKELGFDEQCVGQYFSSLNSYTTKLIVGETHSNFYKLIGIPEDFYYLAPLYQQAFRWFREKGYVNSVRSHNDKCHEYYLIHNGKASQSWNYSTYEEAELACLKELIEIAKNK